MTEIDELEGRLKAANETAGSYGHAIKGILSVIGASKYFPEEDPQTIEDDVKQRLLSIYRTFGNKVFDIQLPEKYKTYIISQIEKDEDTSN